MAKAGSAAANPKGRETYAFSWDKFLPAVGANEGSEGQTTAEIVEATGRGIGWVRDRLRAAIRAGYVGRTTVCRQSDLDGKSYQVPGFVLTPKGARLL